MKCEEAVLTSGVSKLCFGTLVPPIIIDASVGFNQTSQVFKTCEVFGQHDINFQCSHL